MPIIAVSVISTLANLTASGNSGRLFKHTIFYTLFTTVLAATLAAVLYELFAPANVAVTGAAPAAVVNAGGDSYLKYLESVIPDNILAPFLYDRWGRPRGRSRPPRSPRRGRAEAKSSRRCDSGRFDYFET